MRFYEFEAKTLLAKRGVRLPQGGTAETPEEAARLDEYHARVLAVVGPLLEELGEDRALEWLKRVCAPLAAA